MPDSIPAKPVIKKFTKSMLGRAIKVGWEDNEPTFGVLVSIDPWPEFFETKTKSVRSIYAGQVIAFGYHLGVYSRGGNHLDFMGID